MKVESFYDVSCSWCRVGKINFKNAIKKLEAEGKIKAEDIEVIYRTYLIYPDIPLTGGKPDYDEEELNHKAPIHRWGQRVGLEFNLENIKVKPNTVKANQFLKIMNQAHFEALLADLQKAYFEDGVNINELDTVCKFAEKYLSAAEIADVKQRVLAGEAVDQIEKDMEIGDNYNLDLVPCYVFDGKVRLEGPILQKKFEDALLGQLEANV
jgi:predicted DsbA family dithiol-disulfide isomerase